jgi:hypothetical protein
MIVRRNNTRNASTPVSDLPRRTWRTLTDAGGRKCQELPGDERRHCERRTDQPQQQGDGLELSVIGGRSGCAQQEREDDGRQHHEDTARVEEQLLVPVHREGVPLHPGLSTEETSEVGGYRGGHLLRCFGWETDGSGSPFRARSADPE